MSKFSGKCDFADYIGTSETSMIFHSYVCIRDKFDNYKLKQLHFNAYSDLIPYFPHLVAISSGFVKPDYICYIELSSEPWFDTEERSLLNIYLNSVLRVYNRCKRKKIDFDKDECLKEMHCLGNRDVISELIDRVAESGKKATIDNLHLRSHEWYRRELVKEMLKYDVNPKDYGFGRFLDNSGNIIEPESSY